MTSVRTESIVAALAPLAVTGSRDELLVAQPDGNTYVFFIRDGYVEEIQWGQNLTGGSYGGDLCAP